MSPDLEKEEIQNYFYDYVDENHIKIQSLSEKCFSLSPNTMQFVELSSELSGYFSANTWLMNNYNCDSISDFRVRLLSFEQLLNSRLNQEVELCMKISFLSEYYYDDLDTYYEAMKKEDITTIPFSYDNTKVYFEKGKELLKELFSDPGIQSLQDMCHFQIYTGKVSEDWNVGDYYKAILANHVCLRLLKQLYQNIIDTSKNSNDMYK